MSKCNHDPIRKAPRDKGGEYLPTPMLYHRGWDPAESAFALHVKGDKGADLICIRYVMGDGTMGIDYGTREEIAPRIHPNPEPEYPYIAESRKSVNEFLDGVLARPVSGHQGFLSISRIYVQGGDSETVTVEFADGTKTSARCPQTMPFDAEVGAAIAVAKKALGGCTPLEEAVGSALFFPRRVPCMASVYAWIVNIGPEECMRLCESQASASFPEHGLTVAFSLSGAEKTPSIALSYKARPELGKTEMTVKELEDRVVFGPNLSHSPDVGDPDCYACDLSEADVVLSFPRETGSPKGKKE
jgi:hypothetical protein